MKAPSPAFSIYPKDIMSDEACTLMSKEAFGCHVWLLLHAWLEGSIPEEPVKIQRILGLSNRAFKRVWPALKSSWTVRERRLFNNRLETERDKQIVRQEAARANGSKGGRPMKSTKAETRSFPPGFVPPNPAESFPSPSPFPSPNVLQPARSQSVKNPLLEGKRPALESEALRLVREIQEITGEDGIEIIREASSYKDRDGKIRTGATNPATMSDDRLLATVKDLRETLEVERQKHGSAQR